MGGGVSSTPNPPSCKNESEDEFFSQTSAFLEIFLCGGSSAFTSLFFAHVAGWLLT